MRSGRFVVIALVIVSGLALSTFTLVLVSRTVAETGLGVVRESTREAGNGAMVFLPLIIHHPVGADLKLEQAWTRDGEGDERERFFLGETIGYVTSGLNFADRATSAGLQWQLDGPCGSTLVFSDTVNLSSGAWQHVYSDFTPTCAGSYIGTVQLEYWGTTSTLTTSLEIHLPSQIVTSTMHGFDSCYFPTINQMQTWWDESPYYVRNIYLGGINHGCSTAGLTTSWVQAIAQQGWQFILTWVGPQPPCSRYNYVKFSSNPLTAYAQGTNEAAEALEVADSIGLSGEKIIYNDLEIYDGADSNCQAAVNAYVQGWTDWLHLTGNKAGVYAAPCYSNSNMADWWDDNAPPPDDVWIAHWLWTEGYLPGASVWTPCLPDSYWPDTQRLRQYSGDYNETWGGVTIPIDSNIMNGDVTAVTATVKMTTNTTMALGNVDVDIRKMDLLTTQVGWVLQGDHLLWTDNGGDDWKEITPKIEGGKILDVDFIDTQTGWIVVLQADAGSRDPGKLTIYRTLNGGIQWEPAPSFVLEEAQDGMVDVAAAYLDLLDSRSGFLVLKHPSGSSFSQGSLYAIRDSGLTWQIRNAPMGEAVIFGDDENGWMTGGPTQEAIYRTRDGGLTWQFESLPDLPASRVFIGQPQLDDSGRRVLPVTVLADADPYLVLYEAGDIDAPWVRSQLIKLSPGYEPGSALPFSAYQQYWWAGIPVPSRFFTSIVGRQPATLTPTGLPEGLVGLDFASDESGWALVQESACNGDKIPGSQTVPGTVLFSCFQRIRLFRTSDGGLTWQEIVIRSE